MPSSSSGVRSTRPLSQPVISHSSAKTQNARPNRPLSSQEFQAATDAVEQEINVVTLLKRLSIGNNLNYDPDLPYMDDENTISENLETNYIDYTTNNDQLSSSTNASSPLSSDELPEDVLIDAEKLLWVPANAHPEIAPEKFKQHLQKTVNELTEKLNNRQSLHRSSSTLSDRPKQAPTYQLQKSRSDPSGASHGSSQSSTKSPLNSDNVAGAPSIAALTRELEKLSEMAGMSVNDAATLARTLSTKSLGYTQLEKDALNSNTGASALANELGTLKRSKYMSYRRGSVKESPVRRKSLDVSEKPLLRVKPRQRKVSGTTLPQQSQQPSQQLPQLQLQLQPQHPYQTMRNQQLPLPHQLSQQPSTPQPQSRHAPAQHQFHRQPYQQQQQYHNQSHQSHQPQQSHPQPHPHTQPQLQSQPQQRKVSDPSLTPQNYSPTSQNFPPGQLPYPEKRHHRRKYPQLDQYGYAQQHHHQQNHQLQALSLQLPPPPPKNHQPHPGQGPQKAQPLLPHQLLSQPRPLRMSSNRAGAPPSQPAPSPKQAYHQPQQQQQQPFPQTSQYQQNQKQPQTQPQTQLQPLPQPQAKPLISPKTTTFNSFGSSSPPKVPEKNEKAVENQENLSPSKVSPTLPLSPVLATSSTPPKKSSKKGWGWLKEKNSDKNLNKSYQEVSDLTSFDNSDQLPYQQNEDHQRKSSVGSNSSVSSDSVNHSRNRHGSFMNLKESNDEKPQLKEEKVQVKEAKEKDSKSILSNFFKKKDKKLLQQLLQQLLLPPPLQPLQQIPQNSKSLEPAILSPTSQLPSTPTTPTGAQVSSENNQENHGPVRKKESNSSLGEKSRNVHWQQNQSNGSHGKSQKQQQLQQQQLQKPDQDAPAPLSASPNRKQRSASPTQAQFSQQSGQSQLLLPATSSTVEDTENLKSTLKIEPRQDKPNQPIKYTDSAFGFPLPPASHSTLVMLDYRFPIHVERAIYRLSHLKLANPKRPLRQQVLLSNFMYLYLNLVNHSLYLQQQQMRDQDDEEEVELGEVSLDGREIGNEEEIRS